MTYLSNLADSDMAHFNLSNAEKQEFVEEICTELSVYLGMLYFLIEVFKGDDEFGEELSRSFSALASLLLEIDHTLMK